MLEKFVLTQKVMVVEHKPIILTQKVIRLMLTVHIRIVKVIAQQLVVHIRTQNGNQTIAASYGAHAEGNGSQAMGSYSHAERKCLYIKL